jgi:hypothetical protein
VKTVLGEFDGIRAGEPSADEEEIPATITVLRNNLLRWSGSE